MIFYNFYGFFTLTKREIKRFSKVYVQTLLAPLFSNLLFLGIFGTALQNRDIGIEGVSYLAFMIPGLCTLGAIISAFQNPSSSLIIQKFQGAIQDLNTYPITNFEKTLAYLLSSSIRGTIVGFATYISSIPFVGYSIYNPFLMIVSLFIISGIFSGLGILSGLKSETFEKIAFQISFIITPLIYFGGVFFEVSKLPKSLQLITTLNPIVPMIDIVRYSFIGVPIDNILLKIFIVLLIFCATTYASYLAFKKGVGLVIR